MKASPKTVLASDSPLPNEGGVYRCGRGYHWAPSPEAHPNEWRKLSLSEALVWCAKIHEGSPDFSTQHLSILLTDASERLAELQDREDVGEFPDLVWPLNTTGAEPDLESLRSNVRTDTEILLRRMEAIRHLSLLASERSELEGQEKEIGESLRQGVEVLVADTSAQIRSLRRATRPKGGPR